MNTSEAIRTLLETLLQLAATVPLILVGMRKESRPHQLRLLGWSALVVLSTTFATCVPKIFGIPQPWGLYWNWLGKLACILVIVILLRILPSSILKDSGILRLPSKNSVLPLLVIASLCAFLGASAGPAGPVNAESLAFQSFVPSLAEEPIYRAILPALLGAALGSPWKFAGAQVGWWWLVCALLFGAGHAISWSVEDGLQFHAVLFIATGIIGLVFGWLAARCLSVWPCVLGHSLINATGLAVAMISK